MNDEPEPRVAGATGADLPAAGRSAYHLFDVFGVELEYAIVRSDSLDVLPIADELLRRGAGLPSYVSEIDLDGVSWSNELVLHLIELKVTEPSPALEPLAEAFQGHVRRINGLLAPLGGRLMPTAMHPWMDPVAQTRLWPHDYSPVYQNYDRIFDCRGHGWSNLQSVHLNLPFSGDEEFGRLHAALRLLLPILPALAASSPIVEGRPAAALDARMEFYRGNSRRIPSITGEVVPEPVFTEEDYRRRILEPMYRDIAPLDPAGVLRHEWLNSRAPLLGSSARHRDPRARRAGVSAPIWRSALRQQPCSGPWSPSVGPHSPGNKQPRPSRCRKFSSRRSMMAIGPRFPAKAISICSAFRSAVAPPASYGGTWRNLSASWPPARPGASRWT